ncbi:lysozyme inhibitor LprI family protein, partial [Acinetobacter baumannii]
QFTRTLLLPIMPIVFAIAVSQPCHADWVDKDQYPIDKETNKLLDTNASTGEQSAAWDAAYKKWDADMNVQYKKLSAMLKPEERKTLQT